MSKAIDGSNRRIEILGMPVDAVDMESAIARILGFLNGTATALVITADASGIVQANGDPELARLYRQAALVTPDGIGVVWAAKRQGVVLRERVSGVDMVERLCAESARLGFRIAFVGSADGVATEAAERLRAQHPGCQIVFARHGFFSPDEDESVAAEIAQHRPDVLFVAMGIPRQEKFIAKTASIIGAKVAMGVGGSFDVYSGRTKRAPNWVRRAHAEWLWRLLLNPSKIAKVKNLPTFFVAVLKEGRK